MARRSGRLRTSSRTPLTSELPDGPVPVSTGTAELVRDPSRPTSVTLLLDGIASSQLDLADPTALDFEYMQAMAAVIDHVAPPGAPLKVVHLGAAGCAMARYVHATRPGSRQIAVEIDAELARLVRDWFDLPRSPALRLRVGDAAQVLASLPDASTDVVVRDVFAAGVVPAHVQSGDFVARAARVLRQGGCYLANIADRPPLDQVRSETAVVQEAFADAALLAEPALLRGRRFGNTVLVGHHGSGVLGSPVLERAVRSLPAPTRLLHGAELAAFGRRTPGV